MFCHVIATILKQETKILYLLQQENGQKGFKKALWQSTPVTGLN
jgi:hypothetical protein